MHTGAHTHRFPTYILSKKKKSLRLVSTAYLLVGETYARHILGGKKTRASGYFS